MPRACPVPARAARGYTLLEVLIVVFIVGVMLAAAGLRLTRSDSADARGEAERLRALLELAAEESILTGAWWGLALGTSGYRFDRYTGEGWVPVEVPAFAPHRYPQPIALSAYAEGAGLELPDAPAEVQVMINAEGEMTPCEIWFGERAGAPPWRVVADGSGSVRLIEAAEPAP